MGPTAANAARVAAGVSSVFDSCRGPVLWQAAFSSTTTSAASSTGNVNCDFQNFISSLLIAGSRGAVIVWRHFLAPGILDPRNATQHTAPPPERQMGRVRP